MILAMTSNNIIPIELDDFQYTEDGGWPGFFITGANLKWNELIIYVKVYLGVGNPPNGIWEIKITNCRDHRVQTDWFERFEIYDAHPQLLQYTENATELYFSNKAIDTNKLLVELYNQHVIHCGINIPIEKFLNHNDLYDACNADFGLFAKGPISIMDKYQQVLEANGVVCNLRGNFEPKFWDGEKDIPEITNLKLLKMGNSYVIGEDFIFKKLEGNTP